MISQSPSGSASRLWLIILTCIMMLYQIVWIGRVLSLPDNLKERISLVVPLEVAISILFVTLFTYGLRALIVRTTYAVRYTIVILGLLIGYSLLRLILFAEADYDRQRLPFLVILFSIVCCLVLLPELFRRLHKFIKGEESV